MSQQSLVGRNRKNHTSLDADSDNSLIDQLHSHVEELFNVLPDLSLQQKSQLVSKILKLISSPKRSNYKQRNLDDLIDRIGKNIRSLRKARGISQEELAQKCGIHRTYLGTIENGKRNTSIQKIVQISQVLDVSIESILS